MGEQEKTEASQPSEHAITEPRSENDPAESEFARGNVHSRKHDEPDLPAPPPLPH